MSNAASRIALVAAAVCAAGLIPAATAVRICGEEAAPARQGDAAAGPAATAPPPQAKPPQDAPAGAEPPARRILTPEEVRELPVFSRYDAATWQKLLEKGRTLLEDIKDNTFGYDEEAFYWLTYQVCRMNPDLLAPDAECQPYATLLALPSSFRGEPVTIRGVYMSAAQFRVPILALQKDVPHLFECTVKEPPFDQVRPVATVIVKDNPMLYLRAGDDVLVKGYFYKIRRYQGTRGEGFAPMIIAQRLQPDTGQPRALDETPAAGAGHPWADPYLVLMVALVLVLMIAFFAVRILLRKPSPHAPGKRPFQVHRFRLRRPDRVEPPAGGGGGGQGGGAKP